jgi:predicted nucleotidyltransferase
MSLTNSQINTHKYFFSKQPVLRAYIFGSYSRGSENKDMILTY